MTCDTCRAQGKTTTAIVMVEVAPGIKEARCAIHVDRRPMVAGVFDSRGRFFEFVDAELPPVPKKVLHRRRDALA